MGLTVADTQISSEPTGLPQAGEGMTFRDLAVLLLQSCEHAAAEVL